MVVKSGLALRICTPSAPFKLPVATPKVVGLPSITPNPPRLVRIAPPTSMQVFAREAVENRALNRTTLKQRIIGLIEPSFVYRRPRFQPAKGNLGTSTTSGFRF